MISVDRQTQREIFRYFDEGSKRVFARKDLSRILKANRSGWKLPQSTTAQDIVEFLIGAKKLEAATLQSERYRSVRRFIWESTGEEALPELAVSIKPRSYLCHMTAAAIHGLTDQVPRTVYVNYEQSPKPAPKGGLSQEAVERAFAREQRKSKLRYTFREMQIVVLNGKHTGRLEVGESNTAHGERLAITKLERTLIDMAVRPAYSGGIPSVIDAYRAARDLVSIGRLKATLKRLQYAYPYHQSIGFLMERAGYNETQTQRLLELGTDIDFYLAYGMAEKDYDSKWRLFFPKGL